MSARRPTAGLQPLRSDIFRRLDRMLGRPLSTTARGRDPFTEHSIRGLGTTRAPQMPGNAPLGAMRRGSTRFGNAGIGQSPQRQYGFMGQTRGSRQQLGMQGLGRGFQDQSTRLASGKRRPALWSEQNMEESLEEWVGPEAWRNAQEGAFGDGDTLDFSMSGDPTQARGVEGALQHRGLAERASRETGVPWQLIIAVMGVESAGKNNLTSPANAQGLMQIVPKYWQGTARRVAGSSNLMDPWVNVRTGAEVLKIYKDQYGTWERATRAYLSGSPDNKASDAFGTNNDTYVQLVANNLAALPGNKPAGVSREGFNASGKSVWNVTGGQQFGLTQGYGSTSFARSSGGYTNNFHDGIDIGTPQGTTLYAPVSGEVISAGLNGGYGGTVKIRTNDGHIVQLSHMSNIGVRPGQRVGAGAALGLSGGRNGTWGAGWSTGPHLHLTVFNPSGKNIDPRNYFNF